MAAPLTTSPFLSAGRLAAVAVRELLFISLHEILLDALAAEHGMRLTAAESALQWLDHTAEVTARRLSASRSESATQELLDIIAGIAGSIRGASIGTPGSFCSAPRQDSSQRKEE